MSRPDPARPNCDPTVQRYAEQLRQVMNTADEVLKRSPYLPLRGLRSEFHEGVLVLRGRVPTFYLKQLAQTIVSGIEGVEQVANHVEVWPPGQVCQRPNTLTDHDSATTS